MALTTGRRVKFYVSQELVALPVLSGTRIYGGALVGQDGASGRARPLVAGDRFLGLAYAGADAVDGTPVRVMLHQHIDAVLDLPGSVPTDIGADVYAADDEQLTLTAAGNSWVGRIVALEQDGRVRVRLRPWASRD